MDERTTPERAEIALLELLADTPFGEIRLAEVAARAGVGLADLRRAYDGPFDILSGFARRIDAAVLEGSDADDGESRRDRLFDAVMRRFDLLAPHRAGLAGLMRSAKCDPLLAVHLARLLVGSQRWLLEAAGLESGGLIGRLRATALAAAAVRLAPIFLADEGSDLPKTMAALDLILARFEGIDRRVRCGIARLDRCGRRRAAKAPGAAEPAPAGEPSGEPIADGA